MEDPPPLPHMFMWIWIAYFSYKHTRWYVYYHLAGKHSTIHYVTCIALHVIAIATIMYNYSCIHNSSYMYSHPLPV